MKRMAGLAVLLAVTAAGGADRPWPSRETPIVRVVRDVKDAVVNINTTELVERRSTWMDEDIFNFFNFNFPGMPGGERVPVHSLGSGFVIHHAGYIVTNAHVIQRGSEISVALADQTTLKAVAAYADTEHDLAVIKVEPKKPLKALRLGRSDDLMIGETVIAIGNALGYQHTVTTGIISAVGRELEFGRGQVYKNLIQTDASINPGNSGGPLLNIDGELIGINTAIRGDAQNIGFAISVDSLKALLPELLDAEDIRRMNLGFRATPTKDARTVQVVSVETGSPAERAGLAAGDTIVAIDGQPYADAVDYYVRVLERPVGRALALTVDRDGRHETVNVPFEQKPKPDGRRLARQRLGLILEQTTQRSRRGGPDQPVLLITGVLPNSPAEQIGIEKGDVVYQLGRQYVNTLDEVGQVLETSRPGQRMYIGILRASGGIIARSGAYLQLR